MLKLVVNLNEIMSFNANPENMKCNLNRAIAKHNRLFLNTYFGNIKDIQMPVIPKNKAIIIQYLIEYNGSNMHKNVPFLKILQNWTQQS